MNSLDEHYLTLTLHEANLRGNHHTGVDLKIQYSDEIDGNDAVTGHTKKLAPLVPPKPHKKKMCDSFTDDCAQLMSQRGALSPVSHNVRGAIRALENKFICTGSGGDGGFVGGGVRRQPELLQRKQPLYTSTGGNDDNSRLLSCSTKITLDNPLILEQQLEALAHHKKQLEKKGQLNQPHQASSTQLPPFAHIPKLSSMSLFNNSSSAGGSPNIYCNLPRMSSAGENSKIYTNARLTSNHSTTTVFDQLDANDEHLTNTSATQQRTGQQQLYTNVQFDHHLTKKSIEVGKADNNGHCNGIATCVQNQFEFTPLLTVANLCLSENEEDDDRLPTPPSPVSSSYSELRHAITAQRSQQLMPTHFVQHHQQQNMPPTNYSFDQNYCTSLHKEPVQLCDTGQVEHQNYSNLSYGPNPDYNKHENIQANSMSDYYGYGNFSQRTSTYESIYEPINPRPSSQLSLARSNHSLVNASSQCLDNDGACKDDFRTVTQVDTLPEFHIKFEGCSALSEVPKTDTSFTISPTMLKIHTPTAATVSSGCGNSNGGSAETGLKSYELDGFGVCFKCSDRVHGETSGCTAMGQIYHIACFTCSQCETNLQGKPFYALDNRPYCEYDYLQTLEKCSVCDKPILERILRATGKPYHPQCFTCYVCQKSLDGIPFTVDATNQNYCISDFHKKFAPRCCVCKEPIMPATAEEETVRVVALDRSFHFECYKCEDCGLLLSSEAEGRGCYPLDDHVLCKSCNANRVQMLTNRMTTEL